MERLIELIANNFFFVIMIGIFLVSMLSGKRKKTGSQNRMPDFSGQGLPRRPAAPARTEAGTSGDRDRRVSAPPQTRRGDLSAEAAADDWTAAERGRSGGFAASDACGSKAAPAETPRMREARAVREEASGSSPAAGVDLHPRQAVQGVIWAEILGPPRAKKPFRR
ncbi:hypothetical protein [Paenibacillus sp. UNC499MF]|uniref:hypothetical protein n=1 Tax=Paenibacillus sp. UNC499MF TaxID=1502751 RepID=UPI00089FAA9E|nr:hypothetical protein [Paenibacillus sp. UNC499MF]SEF49990.1 hypothetical protein SAMN02799616_00248 [Paenibacillus sp. UNC499MF]